MPDNHRSSRQPPLGKGLLGMSAEESQAFLAEVLASAGDDALERALGRRSAHRLHPVRRTPTYYRVRVDLDHTKPPIWRRLDVDSSLRLDAVHRVLQAAFPWDDAHLHEFCRGPRWSFDAEHFLCDYQVDDPEAEGTPERDVRLDQVMHDVGDKLSYWYDFGDDWMHTIKLEQVGPRTQGAPLARLVRGRRAAPPDDCGGIWGYYETLDVVADPGHPDHESVRKWFEEVTGLEQARDFDPASVDLVQLDRDVQAAVG